MLRELSEDVRIRVKDRLRDFRSIVRQHRHDHAPGRPAPADAKDQPFPDPRDRRAARPCGQRLRRRDVAGRKPCSAQEPRRGARFPARSRCSPIFARAANLHLDGERAFRRDLYRLAKLVLEQKKLDDFRIRESDFAAVHDALEKRDAGLHRQTACRNWPGRARLAGRRAVVFAVRRACPPRADQAAGCRP